MIPVSTPSFLQDRLRAAGFDDVAKVELVEGGQAATAGIAHRPGKAPVFVKSFTEVPADDVFATEAEGLEALRERGALSTPEVVLATREVLVLSLLRPRPADEAFWERVRPRTRPAAHLHRA